MVAFSDRPERSVKLSTEAKLAVELASAYLNGHLPSAGGWLDQDSYHVRLIELALGARSRRKSVADRQRKSKMNAFRRRGKRR